MKKLTESKKSGTKSSKTSIRGKQILVGGLVVLVAVAGYYRFSSGNITSVTSDDTTVPVVSMSEATTESYFASARQDRDSARSEAEDLLNRIAEDDEATADAKAQAREKLKISAENIQKEGDIESLIKSKGYSDCIVFIDEEEIRIVVKAEKLDEDKVSQITEIVTSKTNFKPSQIVISNHN